MNAERKGCWGELGVVAGRVVRGKEEVREVFYEKTADPLSLVQYSWMRKLISRKLNIDSEPIPESLRTGERAIVVFNYPKVSLATKATLDFLCHLPTRKTETGEKLRGRVIGREEVLNNYPLRILGAKQLVLPAKGSEGTYSLSRQIWKETLAFLDLPGSVLCLSITGSTRDNGLSEGDLRTGAAQLSAFKQVRVVPMGIVTEEKKGRLKVTKVKFGEPLSPLNLDDFEKHEEADRLIDYSKLLMCAIAELLPPGQRGDFEDLKQKRKEIPLKIKTFS